MNIWRAIVAMLVTCTIVGGFAVAFSESLDRMVRSGWVDGAVAKIGAACSREGPPPVQSRAGPRETDQSVVTAFLLGYTVGYPAGVRDATPYAKNWAALANDPLDLGEVGLDLWRERLAKRLGLSVPLVPAPPAAPSVGVSAFENNLAADPRCVATALADRFSDRHQAAYLFGAFGGYGAGFRQDRPSGETPLFAEVRHYALAAGAPEPLWKALVSPQGTSDNRIRSEIRRALVEIREAFASVAESRGESLTSPRARGLPLQQEKEPSHE